MTELPDPFELKVMRRALWRDDHYTETLRRQLPFLRVAARTPTGVGFYTDFTVEDDAPSLLPRFENSPQGIPTPMVQARNGKIQKDYACFIVWVNHKTGFIEFLEGVSAGADQWPENIFDGFHDFRPV